MDETNPNQNAVTPLTQSPLSQESRKRIVNNTSISGQQVNGGNLLSPVTPSESEIRNLQITQQNEASLIEVQSGILGIQQNINLLNTGLVNIATLLQQDSVSEERNLRAQQESERRLAEQEIRLGKESEIEKKIENAIVAPVQKLAPKVQDLFGKVFDSLFYLFGGWLTSQVIEYIKVEGEGNNKRLSEIKNNIIKNLGIAGGALLAIKFGFSGLKTALNNSTSLIGSLLGKKVSPIAKSAEGLTSGSKNFVKGLGIPLLSGAAMTGLDIASGEDPARAVAGTTAGMLGSSAAFVAGSLIPIPGSGLVSGALAYGPSADFGKDIYDKFFGKQKIQSQNNLQSQQTNTEQVKPKDQTKSPSSAAPLKPTQQNQSQSTQSLLSPSSSLMNMAEKAEPFKSAPQQEMIVEPKINLPNYSNVFNVSVDNTFQTGNLEPPADSNFDMTLEEDLFSRNENKSSSPSSLITSPKTNNFLSDYNKVVSSTSSPEQISSIKPSQIQGLTAQPMRIGELPEPKPNIIYASSGSSQKVGPQMNQTPSNGRLTDVPMIASSNPDNFYTLYSYSCYNVVI